MGLPADVPGSPHTAVFFASLPRFSTDLPLSYGESTVLSSSLAWFLLHPSISLLPAQLTEALVVIQVLLSSLLQYGPEQCVI